MLKNLAKYGATLLLLAMPAVAAAQGDIPRGVALVGTYSTGTLPGVIVLPMNFPAGDSIRTMLSRDMEFGHRVRVIRTGDSLALPVRGDPDYAFFAQLGARAVVHAYPSARGITVNLHEVGEGKVVVTQEFPVPTRANTPDWRYAIHGMSDVVEEWITGTLGIARTRVAFVRDGDLYVIDFDGANERRVAQGEFINSPSWGPNGRMLVHSELRVPNHDIVIRDADGGPARWLTSGGGMNSAPVFSRDGQMVVYSNWDNGSQNLWAVPASGRGASRRITNERGTDNTSPTLSPDGSRVAFISNRVGNPIVYVMNIEGTGTELLTRFTSGAKLFRESPDWSPDGQMIAYQARSNQVLTYQIEVVNLRDRTPRVITDNGENENPSWGPDSRHIAIESSRSGVKQIWIMDLRGGTARQLTFGTSGSTAPAWSPHMGGSP